MKIETVRPTGPSQAEPIDAILALDGSARHGWAMTLAVGGHPRDLADAAHLLLMLHGRHPGLFDHAGLHQQTPAAMVWLVDAAAEMAAERSHLARLAVAAGPLPSTPGHAESDAAMLAQCHALEMLARSDRTGCALGAAIALALDWPAIRAVLDAVGQRFGVAPARPLAVSASATSVAQAAAAVSPAAARAIAFGARQLLAQHRGLWDLLEARAAARRPA